MFFVGRHVGHRVGHLVHLNVSRHVHHHVGHHHVVLTLCEISGTLTEWNFKSLTDDGLTKVDARDTCVSKNGSNFVGFFTIYAATCASHAYVKNMAHGHP